MSQTYTIEVTRRPVDADDTAGHGVIVPQLTGRLFQSAPGAAIRLTLLDPAPIDTNGLDVQGFSLSVEAPEEEEVHGHFWMEFWNNFLTGVKSATFVDQFETHEVPKNPKGGINP